MYMGEEIGRYASSIYHTLKAVFPQVLVAPGEKLQFFAAKKSKVLTFSIPVLEERFERRGVSSPYFTKYHFSFLLPPDRIDYTRTKLETSKWNQLNTDRKPVTYLLNILLWLIYSGRTGEKSLLSGFLGTGILAFILPVALVTIFRIFYVRFRGSGPVQTRMHLLICIAFAGFAGMASEIVLLFSFQNAFGFLYFKIGFLIALFMLGLAAGGALANRPGKENGFSPGSFRLFQACILGTALFSLLIPLSVRLSETMSGSLLLRSGSRFFLLEIPFYAAILISGFLTGFAFPLAGRLYMRCGASGLKAASVVDAVDNLGAAAGALVTGVLLLPVLGLNRTCLFLFFLGLCAFVLLLFQRPVPEL
jgi:spermidine synthase